MAGERSGAVRGSREHGSGVRGEDAAFRNVDLLTRINYDPSRYLVCIRICLKHDFLYNSNMFSFHVTSSQKTVESLPLQWKKMRGQIVAYRQVRKYCAILGRRGK